MKNSLRFTPWQLQPMRLSLTPMLCLMLCLMLGLAPAALRAQNGSDEEASNYLPAKLDDGRRLYAGWGNFQFGYTSLNTSGMMQFLPASFDDMSTHGYSFGGAGYAMVGKFIYGGRGEAFIGLEETYGDTAVSANGGLGIFQVGVRLTESRRFLLYPMLGVGWGGYNLTINQEGDRSVDQVVADPYRETEIGVGNLVLDLSVGMDWVLGGPKPGDEDYEELQEKKAFGGWTLGLTGGVTTMIPSNNFATSGGDITGADTWTPVSGYLRLSIGGIGGGYAKRK